MKNVIQTILFILLVTHGFYSFSQQVTNGLIWSTDRKLVWTDFQEDNSVEKYPGTLARSLVKVYVTDVDTSKHHEKNGVTLKVYALFIPTLSWARKSTVGKNSVLAHEQLHFDIGELIARDLRKNLAEQKVSCKNYESVIAKTKRKAFNKLSLMQDKYDATHRTKWQKWVDDISNGLASLENYKSVEVFIPLEN